MILPARGRLADTIQRSYPSTFPFWESGSMVSILAFNMAPFYFLSPCLSWDQQLGHGGERTFLSIALIHLISQSIYSLIYYSYIPPFDPHDGLLFGLRLIQDKQASLTHLDHSHSYLPTLSAPSFITLVSPPPFIISHHIVPVFIYLSWYPATRSTNRSYSIPVVVVGKYPLESHYILNP